MKGQGDKQEKMKAQEPTQSRRSFLKGVTVATVGSTIAGLSTPRSAAQAAPPVTSVTDARTSWIPACIGGPVPKDDAHVVFRWMGTVNFEICYKNQIFLISNYYDKGPRTLDLGFKASDVTKATAIFLGHAHFDHMSDTAQVAAQTQAPVYGHQTVATKLLSQGTPASQIQLIQNGSVFQFDGVTVEAVHVYHSAYQNSIMPDASKNQYNAFMSAEWNYPPQTAEEKAAWALANSKGSNDSTIPYAGTFAYLFTFGKDFTAVMYDSHNPIISDALAAVMNRLGNTCDIATVGYQGGSAERLAEYVWPIVETFNAKYLWPAHNDCTPTGREHVATQYLAQLVKNSYPETKTLITLYREPVCWNVKSHKLIPNA